MLRKERQRNMWLFLISAAVIQFVLGLLVMILNIIFIYDGMGSKWYGQPQEMEAVDNSDYDEGGEGEQAMSGGGLKVVSIGEGIIAGAEEIMGYSPLPKYLLSGFFYFCLTGVAMYVLSQKGNNSKKALLGVHVTLILLSFTLVITNACQIGMIHQHAPVFSVEVS